MPQANVRACAAMIRIGNLDAAPVSERPDLLAPSVAAALADWPGKVPREQFLVAEIDSRLADTQAFCQRYDVRLDRSANCVILAARREGRSWFAACVVLATTRADVNNLAKRHLGASKISFAKMEAATEACAMEYGGITPVGLPAGWPVLIDAAVVAADRVVIGSGLRRSKISLPGAALAELPNAVVLPALGCTAS
jgi:prolyl-tRNA editing enzyme YbaK/EbsC (Cys-tRNA(Pro) deacylase)